VRLGALLVILSCLTWKSELAYRSRHFTCCFGCETWSPRINEELT